MRGISHIRNSIAERRRLPRLQERQHEAWPRSWTRTGRREAAYLRAAQAYILISMPTGTSTIFGAFQAISVS
jgi:hypothetical protein